MSDFLTAFDEDKKKARELAIELGFIDASTDDKNKSPFDSTSLIADDNFDSPIISNQKDAEGGVGDIRISNSNSDEEVELKDENDLGEKEEKSWSQVLWENKGIISKQVLKSFGSAVASVAGVKVVHDLYLYGKESKERRAKIKEFKEGVIGDSGVDFSNIDGMLDKLELSGTDRSNFEEACDNVLFEIDSNFTNDKKEEKVREFEKIIGEHIKRKVTAMQVAKEGLNSLVAAGALFVGPAGYLAAKATRTVGYGVMDYADARKKIKERGEKISVRSVFREMFYDHAAYMNGGKAQKAMEFAKAAGRLSRYAGFALTTVPGIGRMADFTDSKSLSKIIDSFEKSANSDGSWFDNLIAKTKSSFETKDFDDYRDNFSAGSSFSDFSEKGGHEEVTSEMESNLPSARGSDIRTESEISSERGSEGVDNKEDVANESSKNHVEDNSSRDNPDSYLSGNGVDSFSQDRDEVYADNKASHEQVGELKGEGIARKEDIVGNFSGGSVDTVNKTVDSLSVSKNIEVKIGGKTDTFSEAIYKAVKKAPLETQEKFIHRVIGDDVEIKNVKKMLGEAVRKLSVVNADDVHDDSVKDLVYKGNIVSLKEDGSWEVLKGTGVYEPRAMGDNILSKGSEAVKEAIEVKVVEVHDTVSAEPDLKASNANFRLDWTEIGGQRVMAQKMEMAADKTMYCLDSDGDRIADKIIVYQKGIESPIMEKAVDRRIDLAMDDVRSFIDERSVRLSELNERGLSQGVMRGIGIDPWHSGEFSGRVAEKVQYLLSKSEGEYGLSFLDALHVVQHVGDANIPLADAERHFEMLKRIDSDDTSRMEALFSALNGFDSEQKESILKRLMADIEGVREKFDVDFIKRDDGLHFSFVSKEEYGSDYEAVIRGNGTAKVHAKGIFGFFDNKEFKADGGWRVKDVLEWAVKK